MKRFLFVAATSIALSVRAMALDIPASEIANATESTPRIVLRVKVLHVEMTPYYPSSQCSDGEMCLPFGFWSQYKAKVREVVSGHWSNKEVTFLNLQHATFIKKLTDDCYVVLAPASGNLRKKTAVPLVAEQLLFPGNSADAAKIEALRMRGSPIAVPTYPIHN
jgi:hypothetical protein